MVGLGESKITSCSVHGRRRHRWEIRNRSRKSDWGRGRNKEETASKKMNRVPPEMLLVPKYISLKRVWEMIHLGMKYN
jgi:hypothetical protein